MMAACHHFGVARLGLTIDGFFLHAVEFRRRHFFVEFVELFGGDVLLIVDPENLVLFLVAHQLFLRGFHLHLQVDELLGEPVGGLHGGFELRLEVLLDIGGGQRIDRARGQLRVGAVVVNLDDARVGNQGDMQVAAKRAQQRRCAVGIVLQGIGDEVRLLFLGMAAELGTLVEIELTDDLEREQIALQDADLGVEVALVVVVDDWHRVFEGNEIGVGLVDDDLANGFVDGCLPETGDGNDCKDSDDASDDQPFSFDENAEIFAQRGFLCGQHVVQRGADRLEKFGRFARLQFAQGVAISRDQRTQCHGASLSGSLASCGGLLLCTTFRSRVTAKT